MSPRQNIFQKAKWENLQLPRDLILKSITSQDFDVGIGVSYEISAATKNSNFTISNVFAKDMYNYTATLQVGNVPNSIDNTTSNINLNNIVINNYEKEINRYHFTFFIIFRGQ